MKFSLAFLLFLLPFLAWADVKEAEDDNGIITLHLEHSLDGGDSFVKRGVLAVEPTRMGTAIVTQDEQDDFGGDQIAKLAHLCQAEQLYLLRVVAQRPGQEPSVHRTVGDPCLLVQGKLNDVIVINLDWKTQMVGLSLSPPKNLKSLQLSDRWPTTFSTKVTLNLMEAGPSPDTSAFVQKMEQEKLAKQRGETKDNRSFFAKYWMYIVPVVLVLAMSSANPEANAGGGGGR